MRIEFSSILQWASTQIEVLLNVNIGVSILIDAFTTRRWIDRSGGALYRIIIIPETVILDAEVPGAKSPIWAHSGVTG